VLASVLAGLIAAPPALAQDLLPDMQTRPLPTNSADIDIVGDELRFTNGWSNRGDGPWETTPAGPASADDCDGDGSNTNDVIVDQTIYQDGNANGIFERGTDTDVENVPAGCMIFHPSHNHFHVEDAGEYSLLSEPAGAPAGDSFKVSFCLLDIADFDLSLPGAPQDSYYDSCSQDVQGISVGWYDEYSLNLDGQSIDIGGIAAGNYCLRSRFDPEDLFLELDETNNLAEQRYFLDPDTGQVTPLSGACLAPLPPDTGGGGDDDPPNTKIKRGPRGKTPDRTPTFRFRADEPATFECKLDAKHWRACESPRTYRRRDVGRHRFKVRATDLAGNLEQKAAKRRFRIVEGN
jgi:Lysyl oxidase